MFGWLFVAPADRRLLGATSRRAPTPWVIAIMSFSIMLIAASGLALANMAGVLSRAIEARYSIELPAGGANLDGVLAAVRSTRGVTDAQAVPESDMCKTLERWLGPAAQSRDLPVPALINFDASPGANLTAMQQRIRAMAPGARLAAQRDSVAPLLHSLILLEAVAFGLVLLLDTHRFTIEVMHGIGATDLQVAHLFQRKIAIDAFIGSIAGAVAAAFVLLLLAGGAAFAGELTGGATLRAVDLAVLALLPMLLTALATFVARTAVLRALREAL